jgi:mannose-6-phosphate isomerase-like protein (cupin superfamily)
MEPTLVMGGSAEGLDDQDWSGQSNYFEYTRAANPVGSGRIPPVAMERFPAARHQAIATGVIPFDLSEQLSITEGPATSPALLTSFIRIAPGASVDTAPVATSELYHVISGSGVSQVNGRELEWGAGDFFVLPANSATVHRASTDTTMYWVTDEREIRTNPLSR